MLGHGVLTTGDPLHLRHLQFQLYMTATVANLTLVAAESRLTGETGCGLPVPIEPWQQVSRTSPPKSIPRGSVKFGRHSARIGLTAIFPLRNKMFPSEFLGPIPELSGLCKIAFCLFQVSKSQIGDAPILESVCIIPPHQNRCSEIHNCFI